MDELAVVGGINANLAPNAFHLWATQYYKCKQDFDYPHFSPVRHFLLCRAIELELKSRHLISMTQLEVKKKYGHDLSAAYNALDAGAKTLDPAEMQILEQANNFYKEKGFEYFSGEDALRGYSQYPALGSLDAVTKKLLGR